MDRRFLISGLQPEQAYRVRVSVRNAVGWSAYSIASSEFRLHSGELKNFFLTPDIEIAVSYNMIIRVAWIKTVGFYCSSFPFSLIVLDLYLGGLVD